MTARTRVLLAAALTAVVVSATLATSLVGLSAATTQPCGRHQLAVTSNGSEGAAGTIYGAWVFKNVSDARCTMSGYPSLQLYGRRGRPIPTTVRRDLPPAPSVVTLRPGDSATFRTSYSDVAARRCPVSSVIEITPPDVPNSLFIPAVLTPCRGLVHVSAVLPGIRRA
jgi:uncharacterized protein DUF4232